MATNLDLDPALVEEAQRLGAHPTKRATVEAALAEYVARRKRRAVRDLFRTLDWPEDYDWKAERSRSR